MKLNNICKLILLFSIFTMTSYAAPVTSNAIQQPTTGQNSKQVYTLQQINGNLGLLLKGASNAKMIYLPTKQQWILQAINLHFIVTNAAVLRSGITLNMSANDIPIGSLDLTGSANLSTSWDVSVPTYLLKNKVINLKVSSYVREYGHDCYNLSSPLFWVYISGDSTVTYQYILQDYTPDLTAFPYPFINDPSLEKDTVIIVFADTPSLNDLTAAFYFANALYQRASWRGIRLIATTLSKLTEDNKTKNNIAFIGTSSEIIFNDLQVNWPLKTNSENKLVDKSNQPIGKDSGVIMLAASTWNPHNALLAITSNDQAALIKAALMIRDPNFVNSVTFNEYALVDYVPPRKLSKPEWSEITFANLGYKDQVLYGNGENVVSYTIDLPMTKSVKTLSVDLDYSVSPFLATSQESFLSLRVNDVPVAGTSLKPSNQENHWRIDVQSNAVRPGSNDLAFVFNLKLKNRECTPEDGTLSWATIFANSTLKVTFNDQKPFLTLATFGAAAKDIVMAVPGQNQTLLQKLPQQILDLGNKFTTSDSFEMILSDSLRKESDNNKDIIFIGNPMDNQQFNQVKNNFPFYYENNKLIIDKKLLPYLAISDETPIGLVEVIPSPFNPNKLLLLVSAINDHGYDLAFELLTNPKKFALVNGNVVLLYENGTFTSLQSQRLLLSVTNTQRIKNIGNLTYIVAVVVFGVLIILILIYWMYRRMRRYYTTDTDRKDDE